MNHRCYHSSSSDPPLPAASSPFPRRRRRSPTTTSSSSLYQHLPRRLVWALLSASLVVYTTTFLTLRRLDSISSSRTASTSTATATTTTNLPFWRSANNPRTRRHLQGDHHPKGRPRRPDPTALVKLSNTTAAAAINTITTTTASGRIRQPKNAPPAQSPHHPYAHNWLPHNFTRSLVYPECAALGNPAQQEELLAELQQALDEHPVWRDMDWRGVNGTRRAACGSFKCFLPSATDPDAGYVMAPPSLLQRMRQTTAVVATLRQRVPTLRVLEFPHEQPQLVNLSTPLLGCVLAEYAYQFHRGPDRQQITLPPHYRAIVVHRVRRAPEPYFLLGQSEGKRHSLQHEWVPFVHRNGGNVTAAYHTLRREMDAAKDALQIVPALACDFQGLVDVDGHFYHMDMDRIFEQTSTWPQWYCNEGRLVPDEIVAFARQASRHEAQPPQQQ